MSQVKRNNILHILIFDILFLIISGFTVEYIIRGMEEMPTIYLWLSSILVLLVILSSFIFRDALCANSFNSYMVLFAFMLSIFIMFILKERIELPFWTIGAIFTAAMVDSGIGLFMGYFIMLQLVNITSTDLVVYLIHVICLLIVCQLIKKANEFKHVIYINTLVISISLLVYMLGRVNKLSSLPETTTLFIISTYIVLTTGIGVFKLSMKKSRNRKVRKNANTAVEAQEAFNGFAYLNEMATELDKMEPVATKEEPVSLEAILNAEIQDLEVAAVDPITDYEAPAGLSPVRETDVDYSEFIAAHNELLLALKEKNKQSYIQSKRVAALASECAKYINANHNFANAIGLFYQSQDENNDFPEKLRVAIDEVNAANGKGESTEVVYITSKEAAIVFLTIKISTLFFFMKAKNSNGLQPKKIVEGTMGNEVFSGTLNNSGLTIKECSEMREYFVEKLSSLF